MTDDVHTHRDREALRSARRSASSLIVAAALVAVVALAYGAIFFYANVLNDSPDELDESDLDEALDVDDDGRHRPAPAGTATRPTPLATP